MIYKRGRTFDHDMIALPKLEMIEIGGKRHYNTPIGPLKSVSTILGERMDHSSLVAWKMAVGEELAARISTQATTRGTAVHRIAGKYLLNERAYTKGEMPANIETFSRIRSTLDERVGLIHGIELQLWSSALRTAGTTDLVAEFDGINSIVDFKTSKREKSEDMILGYFIQTTTYSYMLEERTGIRAPQIAIIIAVDDGKTQVFVKNRIYYRHQVLNLFCTDK